MAINECGDHLLGDDENNLGNNNASDMTEVTSNLTSLDVGDKENQIEEQQQDQPSSTKKWYEGVVVRPVAFRSTSKRLNEK